MIRLSWLACVAIPIVFATVAVAASPVDATIDSTELALLRPFELSLPLRLPVQDTTRVSETTVTADKLNEERLVGDNQQPEWTTHRRFATSRVYVLPPFAIEFEQWWRARNFRHDSTKHLFQSEIGIGLPHRFQLDYYENFERAPHEEAHHLGSQIEARWAFADWGVIPGNPTIYGEWKFNDVDSDVYELKFLLGDELQSGWHWTANGTFEQQVRDAREQEIAVSAALSHTLIDEQLSLGIEGVWRHETANGTRGDPALTFLFGPSLQWRPTSRVHLDVVPLVGVGGDSPQIESYVIFGYDFGGGGGKSVQAPASTRGN